MPAIRSEKTDRSSHDGPRDAVEDAPAKRTEILRSTPRTQKIYNESLKCHRLKNVIEPMQSTLNPKSLRLYCVTCSELPKHKYKDHYHAVASSFKDWRRHLETADHFQSFEQIAEPGFPCQFKPCDGIFYRNDTRIRHEKTCQFKPGVSNASTPTADPAPPFSIASTETTPEPISNQSLGIGVTCADPSFPMDVPSILSTDFGSMSQFNQLPTGDHLHASTAVDASPFDSSSTLDEGEHQAIFSDHHLALEPETQDEGDYLDAQYVSGTCKDIDDLLQVLENLNNYSQNYDADLYCGLY